MGEGEESRTRCVRFGEGDEKMKGEKSDEDHGEVWQDGGLGWWKTREQWHCVCRSCSHDGSAQC